MINNLEITNFKAFSHVSIKLAPYTLLSGLNSSGKSTVLQALALLRQAQMTGDDFGPLGHFRGIALNGELVELGTGRDVLHEDYTATPGAEPEIIFSLMSDDGSTYVCRIGYTMDGSYLPVLFDEMGDSHYDLSPDVFSVFSDGFQYLRADRINPAVTYQRSALPFEQDRFLGARGEYTVDVLMTHVDDPVPDGPLRHPAAARPSLSNQAEAWLSEICPGVTLEAAAIEHTDLVRLGFQFRRPGHPVSTPRRPTNVGFGLTYVLPIITACLTAKPGSMILLENPEAHVHPQGQSAMARLTCAAAAAGAQLVVETHSDHILNGLRLAVKRGLLPSRDVALHYFKREDEGIKIESPAIGSDGMLSQWPSGFFDEWDRSLDQLLDLGRSQPPGTKGALVSILLFLNELSCGTPQSSSRVDAVMQDFVALLRYVKHRRPDAVLISSVKRDELELAQGYYVNQWIGAGRKNRDLWQFIRGMQNHAPYSAVLPPGTAEGAEYRVNGVEARGLGAAHIMDGLLVSLGVASTWDTAWVEAICDELDEESKDIVGSQVTVRHAATTGHAQSHEDWIRQSGLSTFRLGIEIWDARADIYPHLQFLPRVQEDLRDLTPEWVIPVANRLASLNEKVEQWDPGKRHAPDWEGNWDGRVTPEAEQRKRLCWFMDLDGEQRLFDLHARFKPHPGRVHLRLIPEESKARIAYVGRKLGI